MIFQHYTADDFRGCQDILNKKITTDNLVTLTDTLPDEYDVYSTIADDQSVSMLYLSLPGKLLIHGKELLPTNRLHAHRSVQTWLDRDGFPVVVDVAELRRQYPGLYMIGAMQASLFVYAATYPTHPANEKYCFDEDNDHIANFVKGFDEYGVLMDFDGEYVSMSKIKYLIMRGEEISKHGPITTN